MNQELVYAWEGDVEVSSMHIYWEAGGNEQEPNVYYFSYWDDGLQDWVTPDEWIADESQQHFRTQYVFTLSEPVSTSAVRFTRTDEGSENGIGLSQFLVYGEVEEEEEENLICEPGKYENE